MNWEFIIRLKPEESASLFNVMDVRDYAARSIIYMPGDSASECLYFLKTGRVEMYRLTAAGKRLVLRQVLPDTLFGVRALLGRGMQNNFAEVIEDSRVGIISKERFLIYLKNQPELMLRILENTCYGLCFLEERLIETVYSPVSARLASFLLDNSDAVSGVVAGFTHEEIGNRIGAVRQTVTDMISLLRKQGLISSRPRQICIIDRPGLERIIRNSETLQ